MHSTAKPDAAMFPEDWKSGRRASDRMISLVEAAETLLGIEPDSEEKAWVRLQPHMERSCFATRSPHDTILFPTGHPRAGAPRYDWANQPDGARLGYLVPEAAGNVV
jgi:hypothetical protein